MSEYMPWWWSLEVKYVVHVLFLSVKSPDNVTFLKHFMTNVSQQWIDVFDFGDFCGRWIINIYIIDMVLLSIGVHDFFLWVDGNCPALEIVSQNRPLFFISGVDPKGDPALYAAKGTLQQIIPVPRACVTHKAQSWTGTAVFPAVSPCVISNQTT